MSIHVSVYGTGDAATRMFRLIDTADNAVLGGFTARLDDLPSLIVELQEWVVES